MRKQTFVVVAALALRLTGCGQLTGTLSMLMAKIREKRPQHQTAQALP